MHILFRILAQASADKLDRTSLAALFRARRNDGGYQFGLLQRLVEDERHYLTVLLARKVLEQRNARPFKKALDAARKAAGDKGLPLPADSDD